MLEQLCLDSVSVRKISPNCSKLAVQLLENTFLCQDGEEMSIFFNCVCFLCLFASPVPHHLVKGANGLFSNENFIAVKWN